MRQHIRWTDEEWAAIAIKAKALKEAQSGLSWMQIVPICQDGIPVERRRTHFNKVDGLAPLFEKLGLGPDGNPKPVPVAAPAPLPVLEQVPIATPKDPVGALAEDDVDTYLLGEVPIDQLFSEIFKRGDVLKVKLDAVLASEARVNEQLKANAAAQASCLKRVEEVESMLMNSMEAIDKAAALSETVEGNNRHNGYVSPVRPAVPAQPAKRLYRFLLIGPEEKEMPRVKERLARDLNVELIRGDNSPHVHLPSNVDYCLVSGHGDFTRRWSTVYNTYGKRALRMVNGSVNAFVTSIEQLCAVDKAT